MIYKEKSTGTTVFMIGLVLFVVLFSAASGIAVKYGIKLAENETSAHIVSSKESRTFTVVIDAGHGGEDGGCKSGDILEKNLNLDVAERVSGICSLLGINTVMTRKEDTMLYDLYKDLADYSGKKKVYDLKNRVKFTKESGADIYVGIHMNKFPDSSCHGMQIYYAEKNDLSEELAKKIREKNISVFGKDGERELKKGKTSVFVLSNAECPSVLVECGFLSNSSDLERLCSDEGKLQVAMIIASGIFEYSKSSGT